ncbi:MAG TPA: hypothetical protein VNI01_10140 [Elusimicrobiota bacterium]|nr:hypothetical protein [Elusimicrobiota bacterium]
MGAAIAAGRMPGAFNEERTVYAFPRLDYRDSRGAPRAWTIRVRLLRGEAPVPVTPAMLARPSPPLPGLRAEILVEAQQVGGKVLPAQPTYVAAGKNLGRSNATNAITQALRDALGLYNTHKRRADARLAVAPVRAPKAGQAAAPAPAGDQKRPPERPLPMLASKVGQTSRAVLGPADFKEGVTVQRKLNGVRQVAFLRPDRGLDRYSRTGAAYVGQPELAAELAAFLGAARADPLECGVPAAAAAAYAGAVPYLDGELFVPGKDLNWISGQARRCEKAGQSLEFHVFDVFFPAAIARGHNMASRCRQRYLSALFAGPAPPHVRRVEGLRAGSQGDLDRLTQAFLAEGYEGAIARKDAAGYEYGAGNHRSPALLKLKPTFDAEFKVVGFAQGTRGKDVGAILWVCRTDGGREFTVTPKDMTYEERQKLYRCLGQRVTGADGRPLTRFDRDLKGKPLTVQYQELSAKTGVPLRAKALAFRTYEAGPAADPVRALFAECLGRPA